MLLQMALFHSFYGWVVFHCVYVPLLYPCGSGHLGCFHILGVITSSASSLQFTVFPQYMSRRGLLYRKVVLVFEDPSCCFPYWLHQFTSPSTVFKCFFFSTSSPTFICVLLDDRCFGRCEGVTSVGVICISLMITNVEHLLLCLFAICMSSLEKMSFETFGPFLNEVGFLFAIQLYEFLYILGINPLQNIWIADIFSHFISFLCFILLSSAIIPLVTFCFRFFCF